MRSYRRVQASHRSWRPEAILVIVIRGAPKLAFAPETRQHRGTKRRCLVILNTRVVSGELGFKKHLFTPNVCRERVLSIIAGALFLSVDLHTVVTRSSCLLGQLSPLRDGEWREIDLVAGRQIPNQACVSWGLASSQGCQEVIATNQRSAAVAESSRRRLDLRLECFWIVGRVKTESTNLKELALHTDLLLGSPELPFDPRAAIYNTLRSQRYPAEV